MWSIGTLITLYYFPMLPWYLLRTIHIMTVYISGCVVCLLNESKAIQEDHEPPSPVCEIGDEWQTIESEN
jgi:hypothetical protein